MVDTLIDVINEVNVACGLRGNKTAIVETDATVFIRDRVNDALNELYELQPFEIDLDGTTTITPSTRIFSGPSNTDLNNIKTNTLMIDNSNGNIPVDYVTEEFIINQYPLYETAEADTPLFAYFTNGLIGIYPLLKAGASNLTLQYKYSSQFTKLTATTATFPFQDRSEEMRYVKLSAQREYELFKGLGQPGVTQSKIDTLWGQIVAKVMKGKNIGFTGHRKYNR